VLVVDRGTDNWACVVSIAVAADTITTGIGCAWMPSLSMEQLLLVSSEPWLPSLSLLVIILSALYSVIFADHGSSGSSSLGQLMLSSGGSLLALIPLMVALWGSSLFKSGNTGMGFATTSTASTTSIDATTTSSTTEKNK
jgi:hypothetical protein